MRSSSLMVLKKAVKAFSPCATSTTEHICAAKELGAGSTLPQRGGDARSVQRICQAERTAGCVRRCPRVPHVTPQAAAHTPPPSRISQVERMGPRCPRLAEKQRAGTRPATAHLPDRVHGQLRHADVHRAHAQAGGQDGPDGGAARHVGPHLQPLETQNEPKLDAAVPSGVGVGPMVEPLAMFDCTCDVVNRVATLWSRSGVATLQRNAASGTIINQWPPISSAQPTHRKLSGRHARSPAHLPA